MKNPTRLMAAAAAILLLAASAQASIVVETEADGAASNNTIGTAEEILVGDFTTPTPATVFGSGPTATILGNGGDSDVDFYKFASLGGAYLFDIDNDPYLFDMILSLFDSTGTLIAYNDDSFPEDPGTDFGYDSFLGLITLSPGTYFIAVSQFSNFATASFSGSSTSALIRPDLEFGGEAVIGATPGDASFPSNGTQPFGPPTYALHISQFAPAAVPEPSTLLLATVGGLAFVGRALRRRRN